MANFKPNLYPIMYWGLVYGICAGLLLFAVLLLSRFVVIVWFPFFLGGLLWGGYRNYQQQKLAGQHNVSEAAQPPLQEIKAAARDIISATRDMMRENATTDEAENASVPDAEDVPPRPPTVPPPPAT